jgi:hypothetical protein
MNDGRTEVRHSREGRTGKHREGGGRKNEGKNVGATMMMVVTTAEAATLVDLPKRAVFDVKIWRKFLLL